MILLKRICRLPWLFLAAPLVHAQNCQFSRNFGSGTGTDTYELVSFLVQAGGSTTCTTSCTYGGSNITLYLRYGDKPTASSYDGVASNLNSCNLRLSITSPNAQTQLGYRLRVSSSYQGLQLDCQCTNSGTAQPTPSPTSSTHPPPPPPGGDYCFSKDATVEVEGRALISMGNLQVGDKVRTGSGKFLPVYSFGHLNEEVVAEFFQIYSTGAARPLEITGSHLLFMENGKAVRADSAEIGDVLSSGATVTNITTVRKQGVYMPLTADGTIVVEGIVASSYVSIDSEIPSAINKVRMFMNEHYLLHWWMAPYRMMCFGVSSKYCNGSTNDDGILNWLLVGKAVAEFAEERNEYIQYLMGVPLLFLLGFLVFTETLVGSALAPGAILFAVAGLIYRYKKKDCHERMTGTKKEI